jgi:hypothetical protein
MQVLVGLAFAGQAFAKIGLGSDLIEDAVGVGDASKYKRNPADPNGLRRGDVTSMNSREQTLPAGLQRRRRLIGRGHAAVR